MSCKPDSKVLLSALVVTLVSIATSWTMTIPAVYFFGGGPELMAIGLRIGLTIATIVPTLVAFPISYYILKQRRDMKQVSNKLSYLLQHDQLTGLLTRRAFFHQTGVVLKAQQQNNVKQSNAIFYIDLDHFKHINDRFGHAMGDEVLRVMGRVTKNYLNSDEIAGRIGGEEFCIFSPNISPDYAMSRAQKLVDDFKRDARIIEGIEMNCTLSMGVAVSEEVDDLDKLLQEADQLLYEAKQKGRDQVAVEDDLYIAA